MGGNIFHQQSIKKRDQHKDEEGVDICRCIAQNLYIDLIELSVSAFLRAFPPKHGADGVQFLYRVFCIGLVLDVGPNDRSGGFRPQGDQLPFSVGERVHFFLNDIRIFTNASGE